MKLFVDYTNWKGVRAWREIEPHKNDGGSLKIALDTYYESKSGEPKDTKAITTFVMYVAMVDKEGRRRTLRLDHIHGFKTEG